MQMLGSYNDEQLFELLQTGNDEAFNAIFDRYRKRLFMEAYRKLQNEEEAHDIVQDVFLYLWTKKNVLNCPDNLKAYLVKVVHNKCVDVIRKNISTRDYRQQYIWVADTTINITAIENKELRQQLTDAIEMITPASRQAFEELYIHHKSLREIADEVGINVQSVKNHIHRALKILRENLKHSLT